MERGDEQTFKILIRDVHIATDLETFAVSQMTFPPSHRNDGIDIPRSKPLPQIKFSVFSRGRWMEFTDENDGSLRCFVQPQNKTGHHQERQLHRNVP